MGVVLITNKEVLVILFPEENNLNKKNDYPWNLPLPLHLGKIVYVYLTAEEEVKEQDAVRFA